MPDISHVVPESHQHVSARVLATLFQTQREASFTGLMRLNHFPDENLILSFLDGKQEKLYRCHNGVVEILPKQEWQEALEGDCDFVGFLPLPVEGLRFMRIMQEVPVHQVERSALSAEQLAHLVEKSVVAHEPAIVYVRGDNVNRYYLIPGNSTPIIDELTLLEGEARFSLNDASFPKMLPNREYQVVHYASVHDHDVWREHELRLAFHPFMHMLISRFSELAGRVLTERLCQQISTWARESGWKVNLTSNGIVNRHYFDSFERAIEFHVDLMRRFNSEASPALGPRMTDGISLESLTKLDSYRRELLAKYVFSWLGAGSGTAGAWR